MANTRSKIKKALAVVTAPVAAPIGGIGGLLSAPYAFARCFSFKPAPHQFGPGAWILSVIATPLRFSLEVGYQTGKGAYTGLQEGLPGILSLPKKVKFDTDWRCIKAETHIPDLITMRDQISCPASVYSNDGSLNVHYRAVIKARYKALESSAACEQYRIFIERMCHKGIHDIKDNYHFIYAFEMYEAYATSAQDANIGDDQRFSQMNISRSPTISVTDMTRFFLFAQDEAQAGKSVADKVIEFCETDNLHIARSQI